MQVTAKLPPTWNVKYRLPVKSQNDQPAPDPQQPRGPGALKKALDYSGERLLDLGYATSALPKFIYPTVVGTPQQEAMTWAALDNLPMHEAVRPISIETMPSFKEGPNLLGVNRVAIGHIRINASGYDMEFPSQFQETVTHEVGHSNDYKSGMFSMLTRQHGSSHSHFGKPGFVSDYAETQPAEDFAETYRVHHHNPQQLERINPAKAEEMRRLDQPHFLEKLVDKPAYRETGKYVARAFHSVPLARAGLELVRQVTVANLAIMGGSEAIQGVVKGDWERAAEGTLLAGAGAGMAMAPTLPWLGVAATAALGANRGLKLAQEQGASPAQKVAASTAGAVGGTVGGFVAPLALVQAGYSLAGPIGGTVGLVVGGLFGGYYGGKLAAQAALSLTK
ncbi:MAG: hypothetical protein KF760_25700 [Candidatus Eremiobacteraeota bacterium]|nr:hypothetical protein [Candidatus Eremiobacteraeota bacterium]MCW5872449.1 hypothetical protein [Candidatus Eremiobacteraeota bacterium]